MFFAQIARSMTFAKAYLLSGGSKGGPPLFLDQNLGYQPSPLSQGPDDRPPSLSEGLETKGLNFCCFFFLFHPDACQTTILIIY